MTANELLSAVLVRAAADATAAAEEVRLGRPVRARAHLDWARDCLDRANRALAELEARESRAGEVTGGR